MLGKGLSHGIQYKTIVLNFAHDKCEWIKSPIIARECVKFASIWPDSKFFFPVLNYKYDTYFQNHCGLWHIEEYGSKEMPDR